MLGGYFSIGTLWRNHTHLQGVPDPEPEKTEVEIMDPRFSECQIVTAWVSDRKHVKLPDRFYPLGGDESL